jgi:hypothetical protein
MRDRCPDKHRDSAQYSGEKNSHNRAGWNIGEKLGSKITPA